MTFPIAFFSPIHAVVGGGGMTGQSMGLLLALTYAS
jgi:hypothetical protein